MYPTYPPCDSYGCATTVSCCSRGDDGYFKVKWPELVGIGGEIARAKIEKENTRVTGVIIPEGTKTIANFCCNRVWLFVDGTTGNVVRVPVVG